MTPQATPGHHRIEISYTANPPGQVGVRPRAVPRNHTFEFFTGDPGTLTLEFIDRSPLADGVMTVAGGQVLRAVHPGHYLVICRLRRPGAAEDLVLDPRAPGIHGGGELEVPPGIEG
jgi:hypothetical protein